jgi:hypothetical protein
MFARGTVKPNAAGKAHRTAKEIRMMVLLRIVERIRETFERDGFLTH